MNKHKGFYPRSRVAATGSGGSSHAGSVVVLETVRAVGLDVALATGLARWHKPFAVHDPAR